MLSILLSWYYTLLALLWTAAGSVIEKGAAERMLQTVGQSADPVLPPWPWIGALGAVLLVGAVLLYLYRRYRRRETEARFRPLFEAAPAPMLLLNIQRRVIEANAAAARLLHRPRRHVLGETLQDLLGMEADDGEELRAALEALGPQQEQRHNGEQRHDGEQRDGAPVTLERQIPTPDDAGVQVRLRFSALRLADRRFYVAALQDMSDPSERQALFKFFHHKTMDDLPIEVAVLSPKGTYLYANPEAVSEEVSPQWLRGKTDFDLCRRLGLHPEVALRRRSHRRRALQAGHRVHFEEVLPRRDAPPRHVERFYTPILEDDGDVYAVVTYGVDETRLKQQQQALVRARQESKDFTQMKTNLMRNLRHEFRTPLTSILGATELLKDEAPEAQQEFVEIVEQGGRRLMRTLDAMLDLTGLQGGSVDQNPRVVDLVEAAENIASEFEEMAARKDLFLRVQAPAAEVLVRVDPASLYRVLRGLVDNAIKFTDEGGIVVEVGKEEGQAQVRVIDTGVGIAEEYVPNLFDAFRQERGELAREFEGMGVGLAVAHRLVELMGGHIEVDSQKGEGSVFTVQLSPAFSPTGALTGAQKKSENGAADRVRVLVAEQQDEEQKLMRHWLDDFAALSVARSLEEALDEARTHRFDVVFVSAALSPDHAATDLLNAFRDLEGYDAVPLVVIDDNALPGAAEQFEAAGYDGYVPRPLKRMALLDALGDVLAHPPQPPQPLHRPSSQQPSSQQPSSQQPSSQQPSSQQPS